MLLALLSGAACEGPPARSKPWRHAPPDESATAPDAGGDLEARAHARAVAASARSRSLRIHLAAEPATLNPLIDAQRETLEVVEDTVYETLLRHDAAGPTPLLAESYRVIGGTEIQLVLRAGVTFHDGKPFTATDAKRALDIARRPTSRAPRLRAELAMVVSTEAWGPRDLRLRLARPDPYVLRALTEVPMMPAHLSNATLQSEPVGTGPYRVASWTPGERITLERAERYWGAPAAIATVEFVIEPDAGRALLRAKRGEIDIVPALIPEHWPEQAQSPDVVAAFRPLELAPARYLALALNERRPPFDDVRVRRAAVLLVDRARLARETWRGLARPVPAPIWPGGPGDAPAPPAPFDPVRGILLLEDSLWKLDKDGVRARAGGKLHATILATSAADRNLELAMAGLRRGGFAVDVQEVAPPDLAARLKAGDFEAALIDYRGRVDEDVCPFFITGGSRNFGGMSAHAADAACAVARASWDATARRAALVALAGVVATEAPHVPLVAPAPQGLISRRVGNLQVHDGWFSIRSLTLENEGL